MLRLCPKEKFVLAARLAEKERIVKEGIPLLA
jgi:hypothetical protein